jgi:hypothetical protein
MIVTHLPLLLILQNRSTLLIAVRRHHTTSLYVMVLCRRIMSYRGTLSLYVVVARCHCTMSLYVVVVHRRRTLSFPCLVLIFLLPSSSSYKRKPQSSFSSSLYVIIVTVSRHRPNCQLPLPPSLPSYQFLSPS